MGGRACHAHGRRAAVGPVPQRTAAAPAGARRPAPGLFDAYAGVVQVLASEHGEALEPCCAALSCCCCARWACCPALDADHDAGMRWSPTRATRWWPKAACARLGGRACQPARAASGCAAAALDEARQLHRHAACLRAGGRPNSNPSCGRCCNTIAAAHAAHPPAHDGPAGLMPVLPTMTLQTYPPPHRPVGQRQQGRPGAQHAPPGHSQRAARRQLCLQAGAQGITVHPRPDERHIRAHDVHELAALLKAWPDREYNIEGNPSQNLMDFIRQLACARSRPPLCPTAKTSSPATTAGAFRRMPSAWRPLIAECKAWACA
jgi:hypothetical protein